MEIYTDLFVNLIFNIYQIYYHLLKLWTLWNQYQMQ
jgi:hypothetical protein